MLGRLKGIIPAFVAQLLNSDDLHVLSNNYLVIKVLADFLYIIWSYRETLSQQTFITDGLEKLSFRDFPFPQLKLSKSILRNKLFERHHLLLCALAQQLM